MVKRPEREAIYLHSTHIFMTMCKHRDSFCLIVDGNSVALYLTM